MEQLQTLILGSGPAGYTAAIYAGRSGLSPVIYEGLQPGGQLTQTTEVDNFPGYPEGVDGNQLMADLRNQALRFGTEIRTKHCVKADLSQRPFTLTFMMKARYRHKPFNPLPQEQVPNTSDFPTKRSIEASEYQLAPLATVSSIVRK